MAKNPIFREYIGSGPDILPDFPGEIINPDISEFHFMLAFAVDTYSNGKGMGTFIPTWNETSFSLDHIRKLKSEHKNAKVMISIGGRGNTYPFIPFEKKSWIDNAENTLKAIIDRYSNLIDGIDVNYEYVNTSTEEFVTCLGQLLNRLVLKRLIHVVSISPSASVLSQHTELFKRYKDIIDWVNYQFYDETLPLKKDFVERFNSLCAIFPREKLFAGYSTDPKDAGVGRIEPDDFFEGCRYLVNDKLLHGIFIWNANYSATYDPPFSAEKRAQEILLGFNL